MHRPLQTLRPNIRVCPKHHHDRVYLAVNQHIALPTASTHVPFPSHIAGGPEAVAGDQAHGPALCAVAVGELLATARSRRPHLAAQYV
jgi:hypothetical protein